MRSTVALNRLSARKLQCHSRRSKLISKILFIYRQNILAKQLSQAMCYEQIFILLHASKFQNFFTKLSMKVKDVKLFTRVL